MVWVASACEAIELRRTRKLDDNNVFKASAATRGGCRRSQAKKAREATKQQRKTWETLQTQKGHQNPLVLREKEKFEVLRTKSDDMSHKKGVLFKDSHGVFHGENAISVVEIAIEQYRNKMRD